MYLSGYRLVERLTGSDCQCQSRKSSNPASSDTVGSEGWKMKKCFNKLLQIFFIKQIKLTEVLYRVLYLPHTKVKTDKRIITVSNCTVPVPVYRGMYCGTS
jgi:hypothetical protein